MSATNQIEESIIKGKLILYSKEINLSNDLDVLVSKTNTKSESCVDFSCYLQFLTRGMIEKILKAMDDLENHITS